MKTVRQTMPMRHNPLESLSNKSHKQSLLLKQILLRVQNTHHFTMNPVGGKKINQFQNTVTTTALEMKLEKAKAQSFLENLTKKCKTNTPTC